MLVAGGIFLLTGWISHFYHRYDVYNYPYIPFVLECIYRFSQCIQLHKTGVFLTPFQAWFYYLGITFSGHILTRWMLQLSPTAPYVASLWIVNCICFSFLYFMPHHWSEFWTKSSGLLQLIAIANSLHKYQGLSQVFRLSRGYSFWFQVCITCLDITMTSTLLLLLRIRYTSYRPKLSWKSLWKYYRSGIVVACLLWLQFHMQEDILFKTGCLCYFFYHFCGELFLPKHKQD